MAESISQGSLSSQDAPVVESVLSSSQSSFPSTPKSAPRITQPVVLFDSDGCFIEISCGLVKGNLYVDTFRGKGSNGRTQCVKSDSRWFSLAQFQDFGGKASTRNWKKSVLYNDVPLEKYLSWLMSGNLSSPKVSVSSKVSSSSPSAISRISSYTTSDSSVHMSYDSVFLEMEQSLSARIQNTLETVIQEALEAAFQKIRNFVDSQLLVLTNRILDLEKRFKCSEVQLETNVPQSGGLTLVRSNPPLADVNSDAAGLTTLVHRHDRMIELQHRQAKRNNIIVTGVDEPEDGNENLLQTIDDILQQKLGIESGPYSVYRIGQKRPSHSRLIVIKFLNYDDKVKVLKNKSRLKGSNIFIKLDLTFSQRSRRRTLLEMCKEAWSDGKKAFIRNDSIVVNGVSCKAYPPSSPVAGHISSNSDNLITDVSFTVFLSGFYVRGGQMKVCITIGGA